MPYNKGMVVQLCALGSILLGLSGDMIEVKLKHVRPSKMQALFDQPKTKIEKFEADDFKGTLRIWGDIEDIERTADLMRRFDVPRMQLYLRFKVTGAIQRVSYDGTAVIPNNLAFTIADAESGARITRTPRVMDDGLIYETIVAEFGEARFQTTSRNKPGVQYMVKVLDMTPMNDKAREALTTKDKRLWPEFAFSANIAPREST